LDAVEQQEFRGFSYAAAWIAEATW
jgi:hypothetical protein